eukprot:gnl/MRDRNA2_/MRDRNA2_101902_c0_seq1.p1 gnl/MRDRNA2_/MRDRNA2_101902_c0~~gnl/MRDRNA2_/MRDRNA2_101902_c0_seq1.p1  ORF type:complete len:522 (-),score=88.55 gnl/MRDRNA2_/MRDRNA2_101902_c0_seq1:334-1899(-)
MYLSIRALIQLLLFWDYVAAALLRDIAGSAAPLKQSLPFYHTSDELRSALQDAAVACKTATVSVEQRTSQDSSASLDVVFIKGSSGSHEKQKALLFFGEHARELVSSESALHFLKSICGLGSVSEGDARKTLANTNFVLVPNSNPRGRDLVDSGHFCKRTNENGVDLNRNWGNEHRDEQTASNGESDDDDSNGAQEENPGPSGFSEPETQVLRDLASEVSPRLFLSIHSGAYLLGMPFGFSFSEKPQHANEMVNILSGISTRYCGGRCPYGSLAQTIGYNAKGCSIDYLVQDLKVPFAFTWEIYTDTNHMEKYTAAAQDDIAAGRKGSTERGFWDHLNPSKTSNAGNAQEVSSVSTAASAGPSSNDESCMRRFNPMTEGALGDVLDIWTKAYLDVANQVAAIPDSGAHESDTSSSETPSTINEHGLSINAHSKDIATPDAPQSDGSGPASASEYMEHMSEHLREHLRASEQHALKIQEERAPQGDDTDDSDRLNFTVPSWDALKPGGKWDFLRQVPTIGQQ